MRIRILISDDELSQSFQIMRALRPHLEEQHFLENIKRQQKQGYQLAAVFDENNEVSALAGYRFAEFLAWGKVLYLDDLITDPSKLRKGYASALLDWLEEEGKRHGCVQLHLDSGYTRNDAHRLYLNKGWEITSHHISKVLVP